MPYQTVSDECGEKSVAGRNAVSAWDRLLQQPHACGHFVQLYQADQSALRRNLGIYFWEGLRHGGGVLAITTDEHKQQFTDYLQSLGADTQKLTKNHQLVFRDARELLSKIIVRGQPRWDRFDVAVRAAVREVRPLENCTDLRAYGEMVGILWNARQYAAAVRLEQLWNKLLEEAEFSLYCSYAIDVLGHDVDLDSLEGVLRTHTHLLPVQPDGDLETALHSSLQEELGFGPEELKNHMKARGHADWPVMPNAEWLVLALRKYLPEQAHRVIERARQYCQMRAQPAV